ncbi:DUF3999 family protein [Pseudoduganella sp. UC29_106]|uniref:DUF3999 family protein n=1 Tax=Pseudoduganella sp. UC29_106 TaxID=3374553 RepID=UPI0037572B72
MTSWSSRRAACVTPACAGAAASRCSSRPSRPRRRCTRDAPAAVESLLLPAQAGREARDLQYAKPPGVPATRAGLQFDGGAVVLPATLGRYREQARKGRIWFEPVLRTTFYRLERDGKPYESADILVPSYLGDRWVLRFDQPPAASPALRVSWQPATLVFVAGGTAPYSLAVGRDKAVSAERAMSDVAPGFKEAELRSLEQARDRRSAVAGRCPGRRRKAGRRGRRQRHAPPGPAVGRAAVGRCGGCRDGVAPAAPGG